MGKRNEVTIYDIAAALNLSTSTISRALKDSASVREQTRSQIRRVATELGYQRNGLAKKVRPRRSHVMGAMVTHLNTPVASSVLSGTEEIVAQAGYSLIFHQSMNKPEVRIGNFENLIRHDIEGILITSTYFQEFGLMDEVTKLTIPSVVVEASSFLPSRPKKQISDYENARELTQHLIDNGCRRIAFVCTDVDQTRRERFYSGYKKAMQDTPAREVPAPSDHEFQDSWLEVLELFGNKPLIPDAIIFCHPLITAIASCQGRSINGSGFWTVTCRKGNISSQTQRLVELGKVSAALLLALARKADPAKISNVQHHEISDSKDHEYIAS